MKIQSRGLILGVSVATLFIASAAQNQEGEPEAILLTLQPAQTQTPLNRCG